MRNSEMGGFDTPFSLLLCKEDESSLIQREESDFSESEIEYIQFIIKKESSYFQSDFSVKSFPIEDGSDDNKSALVDCSNKIENWVKSARFDAIKWILKARSVFGFHYCTAYLSLMYLDHFLSRQTFDEGKEWVIQLGSVACFSLAAKMEERNVPALSRYQMDGFIFDGRLVKRMELCVLSTLKWKMGLTTPFAYLQYFIFMFCDGFKPEEIYVKESTSDQTAGGRAPAVWSEVDSFTIYSTAIEFILAIVEEINLVDFRPSVVAAAVVLAAYDGNLTIEELESKISVISSWGSPERENVHSCYKLLREIELKKGKTPVPRNLMQNRSTSSDVLGSSSIKRKLTFNECDENCPIQKIRRQLK